MCKGPGNIEQWVLGTRQAPALKMEKKPVLLHNEGLVPFVLISSVAVPDPMRHFVFFHQDRQAAEAVSQLKWPLWPLSYEVNLPYYGDFWRVIFQIGKKSCGPVVDWHISWDVSNTDGIPGLFDYNMTFTAFLNDLKGQVKNFPFWIFDTIWQYILGANM